mgnify:CR=1 FL=1
MSIFDDTRTEFSQQHFTIVEIDLPVVEGECTISGEGGFGTPKTCDQSTTGIKTYKFTQVDAPLLPESGILRIIKSINETPAELQPGKGLASRGTASITMVDVLGDPNPFAPAVIANGEGTGLYLAKLAARNEVSGKNIRIKNYRLPADGSTVDLVNGAQTRHYILESLNPSKSGSWTFNAKDELSRVDLEETVWPLPTKSFINATTNDSQPTIFVDTDEAILVNDTLRVGEEFMKVINVGSGSIVVQTRGTQIVYTNLLTETIKEAHSTDDSIFICEISDNELIADLLERILLDVGVDASYIPKDAWDKEMLKWHPTTRVNTLWYESEDTNKVLETILTYYMIDMWFDPIARLIKLSAISAWQPSQSIQLIEGNQIDFQTVSKKRAEQLRATRAVVVYNKPFLATSDSIENFRKSATYTRTDLESSDLFGKPKVKKFDSNRFIDRDGAILLTNRYVNRFIDPNYFTWTTQESKLTFNVGDVVDKFTSAATGFDGLPTSTSRAQILAIKPRYTKVGREYSVKALSYEPLFETGSEVPQTGATDKLNLHVLAGRPPEIVELVITFDGVIASSTSTSIPAITVGDFAAGSKLIIILANGAKISGKGGDGGQGEGIYQDGQDDEVIMPPRNGTNGGIAFLGREGVEVDIHFTGDTSAISSNYPLADGFLLAPSGGDGGFRSTFVGDDVFSGKGGDGARGQEYGSPGLAGETFGTAQEGSDGAVNTAFGINGVGNAAVGGLVGKGIVDNGGVINLIPSGTSRYINGGGDHPSNLIGGFNFNGGGDNP